jgi:hypothetical protein
VSQAPSALAAAWFATVATKMPAMIGAGLRNRRREQQREQLRLVADLAQRNDADRDRESLPDHTGIV